MDIKDQIHQMGRQALQASRGLAKLSTEQKNAILLAMAGRPAADGGDLARRMRKDIAAAEADGSSSAMVDRLRLDHERLAAVADGDAPGGGAAGPGG